MVSRLLLALALSWAAVPVNLQDTSPPAIVPFAVTIEGTASVEVTADTCVAVFIIAQKAPKAEEAIGRLKPARKIFESAVRSITGNSADIEFDRATVERPRAAGKTSPPFEARQTARVRTSDFPKDEDEFSAFLSTITAAVFESGVVAEEVAAPVLFFEVTNPQVLEERLAKMAVEDATKRAALAAKELARSSRGISRRNLRTVRSGYFPSGVVAQGRFTRFSDLPTPVVAKRMKVVITYTVHIAFELER